MFDHSTTQIWRERRICIRRKTGVSGEKPLESDQDRQISAHVQSLGINPRSWKRKAQMMTTTQT